MSKKNKLTDQQELFCREYIKDLNATAAAIRAGYSDKTAQEQSSRLLSNVMVKQFTQVLLDKRSAKLELDANDILKELMKIGYFDASQVFDEHGKVKNPSEWPEGLGKCISSFEAEEEYEHGEHIGTKYKLKFWDKTKCLELMGKHKKLFADTIKVEHSFGSALQKAIERKNKAGK